MKDIDLSPLRENDTQYLNIVTMLGDRYKCEWNDSVHDSYGRYVKQLQEHSGEVRTIRCKAEALQEEADALKVEELKRKAETLCREADSV